jgi:hypothetical protein
VTVTDESQNAVFIVSLDQPVGQTSSIDYFTSDVTAVAGVDYTAMSGTLTFKPGESQHTITIPILKDTQFETSPETFHVNLINPVGVTLDSGSSVGVGTIESTALPPAVTIDDGSVTKPTSGTINAVLTLHLSAASEVPATVNYSTADITAVAGKDYVATSSSVTFAPGEVTKPITIPILGSTIPEGDRTFAVNLSGPTNATIGRAQAIVTIHDINPPVGIFIDNPIVQVSGPAGATATFTVRLPSPSGQTVSVNFTTADGTAVAGTDYIATSGTVTFPPGQTMEPINVQVLGQTTPQPIKTFSVNLTNPVNATISIAKGTATIQNTIASPSLSIVSMVEVVQPTSGTVNASFPVTLSSVSGATVTVSYFTSNVTALSGTDYIQTTGTLTFTPGQTVQTINVPILAGSLVGPNKAFTVTLTGPTNALIAGGAGVATGTILNNSLNRFLFVDNQQGGDGSPAVPGMLTFHVTLNLPTDSLVPITVQYATSDMTAIAGVDYQAVSGILTFPTGTAGQYTMAVNVPLIGDDVSEPTKQFALNLTNATNATISIAKGIGTILNDDPQPLVSIAPVVVINSSPSALFPVALSHASGQTITVAYSTSDGDTNPLSDPTTHAVAGTDYVATTGTLTFNPGETTKFITVPILKDTIYEPTEVFTVTLINPTNATLLTPTVSGTILTNALPPSVTVADFSQLKTTSGNINATATLQLSAPSEIPATVHYFTSDLTAHSNLTMPVGADYVFTSGVVTFNPGEVTKFVNIPIIGSTLSTGDRTFALNLDVPTNVTIARAQAIGTIHDPNPLVGLFVDNTTATVTGPTNVTATFNVHLAQASGLPVQVNYATANGTAVAGADYLATSGVLMFPPGTTTMPVLVTVLGSSVPEATKTFTLNLSSAVNSTISVGTATGTIINAVPSPALSIDDVTVIDMPTGTLSAVFHVSMSASSGLPVTVSFFTSDVSAHAGTDYTPESGSLTFAPGQTVQTITVPIINQTTPTPNRVFDVNLSGPTNASLAKAVGIGTIDNSATLPRFINISDIQVPVGAAGATATFTLTLTSASASPVTVQYATADITAVAGIDYLPAAGLVTFNPGQTTQTIDVSILGVTAAGPSKQFALKLTNSANASLSRTQAVATLVNTIAQPALSVNNVTVTNLSPNATFTVSLVGATTLPVSVQFATMDGTALAGREYTATSGTLTFSPGQTSLPINVPILKDAVFGPASETFTLNLSNPTNATILTATGRATIINTTLPPQVTIDNFSQVKPMSGLVNATTMIHLLAASELPATVFYHTADISAVAGVDYVATTGSVTFAPGETSKSISIPIIGSTVPEGDRTFAVDLDMATGATIAVNQAIGTIHNVNPPVGLSIDNTTVTQGMSNTTAVFTVHLAGPSGLPVSVDFTTSNQTATAGHDYLPTQGTLTFAPGETSKTISVTVLGENVAEDPETFAMLLSNPVNTTIAQPQAIATITNVVPAPNLSVSDAQVVKPHTGTVNAVFTVTLSQPSAQIVTVGYATSDITAIANADYLPTSGMLTFAPGDTVKTVIVPVFGNMTPGPNKTFALNLQASTNAIISRAQGIGTIVDLDVTPSISINNVTVTAGLVGKVDALFTVTLSQASSLPISVNFATADGDALAGVDYVAASGKLTFAPRDTTKTIDVQVLNVTMPGPTKHFTVMLSGASNATLTSAVGTATILNSLANPTVTIGNVTVTASQSGTLTARFTVQLSGPSGLPITVNFATADNTALQGRDYLPTSGTLTFAPGVTLQTIPVTILAAPSFQATRSFFVNISSPSNATLDINDAQGIGTILNTVQEPSVTIGNATVTAPTFGTVLALFTVKLSAPSGDVASVDFSTADGSAMAGVDYTPTSGTVTFQPGETVKTIAVTVLANTHFIGSAGKVFLVTLSNPVGITLANAQGVGTILSGAAPPSLAINDVTVAEGDLVTVNAVFTVTLSSPSQVPATVNYATADITAVAGRDYIPASGTLTFAPGQTSQTISIAIPDDLRNEGNETFAVKLSSPTNASIVRATGIGLILDNDTLVVTTTADSGPGSLRRQILKADVMAGPSLITFDIPGTGPFSIDLRSALPRITRPVTIDATTEPGYDGTPLVQLNGAGAGQSVDGLRISAGNTAVFGVAINRFSGSGIVISGRGGDLIQGDYIGTSTDGTVGLGNHGYGIDIEGSPSNLIGGSDPPHAGGVKARSAASASGHIRASQNPAFPQGNVISGNFLGGVHIAGASASGNILIGNFIGTNSAGNFAIPNGQNGVFIDNAPFNTLVVNVISGNLTNGVKLYGPGTIKNRVQGNIIGAAANGRGFLGNQGFGILLSNVSPKAQNIIAPNTVTTNNLGKLFGGRALRFFG